MSNKTINFNLLEKAWWCSDTRLCVEPVTLNSITDDLSEIYFTVPNGNVRFCYATDIGKKLFIGPNAQRNAQTKLDKLVTKLLKERKKMVSVKHTRKDLIAHCPDGDTLRRRFTDPGAASVWLLEKVCLYGRLTAVLKEVGGELVLKKDIKSEDWDQEEMFLWLDTNFNEVT